MDLKKLGANSGRALPNFREVQAQRQAEKADALVADVGEHTTEPTQPFPPAAEPVSDNLTIHPENHAPNNEQTKDTGLVMPTSKSNAGRKKWADPAALPKGPKPSETTERVQVCVTPEEHSDIMTMKYRHKGMKGNCFLHWAVSDTMNHTYRCTSPKCDGEFTARTTSTMDAPVPMCCPFCGQKNILPVKF